MRTRHLAVAGLAAVLLTACGGGSDKADDKAAATSSSAPSTPAGNGEAAKTGPQVAADAADALLQAGAVHVVGTGMSDGKQLALDLHLQGSDVSGSVGQDGQTIQLISTGGKTYVQAPATFWAAQGLPAAAGRMLDKKWVVVPSEESGSLTPFTLSSLADQLRKPEDTTWKDPVQKGSFDGKDVVVITESDGSTTDVAATGTPYPLHAEDKGKEPGSVTLSDFGLKQPIAAPPSPLDLSKLGR